MQLEFGENPNGFVILGKFPIQKSYQKCVSTKKKFGKIYCSEFWSKMTKILTWVI